MNILFLTLLFALSLDTSFAREPLLYTDLDGVNEAERTEKLALHLKKYGQNILKADVIALGESGHGVAAFHSERSFLSKFFITEHNFRQILIEGALVKTAPLTKTITACTEKRPSRQELATIANSALDAMIYGQQEFFDLVHWSCEWNFAHPTDPISLSGIDLWDDHWVLKAELYTLLQKMNLGAEADKYFNRAVGNCYLWNVNSREESRTDPYRTYYFDNLKLDPAKTTLCQSSLTWLTWTVEEKKNDLIKKFGQDFYSHVLSVIDSSITREKVSDTQYLQFFTAMNLRDAMQARQVLRKLSHKKTLFLAHNVHVGKKMSAMRSDVITPSENYPGGVFTSSGEILRGNLGPRYVAIGVGGLDLQSIRDGQYPIPTDEQSLDFQLSKLCPKTCILDSSPLKVEYWMHNETSQRGMWGVPSEQFDHYFFIHQSAPATPINPNIPLF